MYRITTGTYTGTGSAVNVEFGFEPAYVRCFNETDGDIMWEWFSGMTNGHALQVTNHAATQVSKITSNGISAYAGAAGSAAKGITFGSALSESGKTFRYVAFRGD